MQLAEIKIRNFRNFVKNTITINQSNTIILGENGSGKTNLFRCIRMLIDKRYHYRPDEKDFPTSLTDNKGHWIILQAKFEGVDEKQLGKAGVHLNPKDGIAWINYFFRPGAEIRENLIELCNDVEEGKKSKDEISQFLGNIDIKSEYECLRTLGELPDYTDDENYKKLVGDFENLDFTMLSQAKNQKKAGFRNDDCIRYLNVIFVKAGRDPFEEIARDRGLIQQIIEKHSKDIEEKNKKKIEDAVKILNFEIDNFKEFDNIEQEINGIYKQAIGSINARNATVCSLVPDDFNNFTKYLGINIDEGSESYNIGVRSLGEHSLLYLILRLVKDKSSKKQKYSLVLLEEPEVHLHTHLQRTLFRNVQTQFGSQMIMSTHSQNISDAASISKMVILEKKEMATNVYYPSSELKDVDIKKTERYLDANRTPLLFARSVILVEGDAEAITLPWLFEKHFNASLDEYCVSLINMDSTFFEPISKLFDENRIRRRCFILTDLDKDYTVNKERAKAEKSGQERKEKLDLIESDNDYLKVFYAENTFEVQFYLSNIDILKKMVNDDQIYTQKSKKEEIIKSLDSQDVRVKSEAIMECVEYLKKGWMALKLIDYCDSKFLKPNICDYIKGCFNEVMTCNACR